MKITNAMYLISSNKVRKARNMLTDTEPFFFAIMEMMERVVKNLPENTKSVYLEDKEDIPENKKKRGYIVITDDKGLAGAYNHNVIRAAEARISEDPGIKKIFAIGEVGRSHFDSKDMDICEAFAFTSMEPSLHRARKLSSEFLEYYTNHEIDELNIVYTTIKGAVCETRIDRLLPMDVISSFLREENRAEGYVMEEFLMEPSPGAVLDNLVPNYITGFLYGAMVEAFCAVQSSRMQAMDSANKSAEKMLSELKRSYNRQRQALITQEITEVVGGAKALKRARETKERARAQKNAQ
jgi:F-type H+-transporting ATPase subunit gamma